MLLLSFLQSILAVLAIDSLAGMINILTVSTERIIQ